MFKPDSNKEAVGSTATSPVSPAPAAITATSLPQLHPGINRVIVICDNDGTLTFRESIFNYTLMGFILALQNHFEAPHIKVATHILTARQLVRTWANAYSEGVRLQGNFLKLLTIERMVATMRTQGVKFGAINDKDTPVIHTYDVHSEEYGGLGLCYQKRLMPLESRLIHPSENLVANMNQALSPMWSIIKLREENDDKVIQLWLYYREKVRPVRVDSIKELFEDGMHDKKIMTSIREEDDHPKGNKNKALAQLIEYHGVEDVLYLFFDDNGYILDDAKKARKIHVRGIPLADVMRSRVICIEEDGKRYHIEDYLNIMIQYIKDNPVLAEHCFLPVTEEAPARTVLIPPQMETPWYETIAALETAPDVAAAATTSPSK